MKTSDQRINEDNPRLEEIESLFDGLWANLRKGNGVAVRDELRSICRGDRRLFNALYWRTDDWFKGYMARTSLSESETKVGMNAEEAGAARWASLTCDLLGFSRYWQTDDIPRLMAALHQPPSNPVWRKSSDQG